METPHPSPLSSHFFDKFFWLDLCLLLILGLLSFLLKTDGILPFVIKFVFLLSTFEFLSFVLLHFVSPRNIVWFHGILGGFISSTMMFLRYKQDSETQQLDPQSTAGVLILATMAMLTQAWLLMVMLLPKIHYHLFYPILLNLVGLAGCLTLAFKLIPPSKEHSFAQFEKKIDRPILWINTLKLCFVLVALVYLVRFLNDLIELPTIYGVFILSFFEAHAILGAVINESVRSNNIQLIEQSLKVILIGHVMSKSFLVTQMKNFQYKKILLSALLGPAFLALLIDYLG